MKTTRTIIFTILLAAILMAAGVKIGVSIKHNLQRGLENNYAQQEFIIGNEVAGTLQSKVQNIQNSLSALALDPDVQNPNPNVCVPALQKAIQQVNLGIGNLGRVNSKGIFYCSINNALIGVPANKLGTYVQQLINDPKHNAVLSHEIKVPNVTGYVTAIHVPVYDSKGTFSGTLGGAIYLNQLAANYLDTVKFAKTGYASLQDDNGDILYSRNFTIGKNIFSPAIQKLHNVELNDLNKGILAAHAGKTSTVRFTNAQNIKKIAAIVPVTVVPNHRWIVIVNVPLSEISTVFVHTGLNNAFNILTAIYCGAILVIAALMVGGTLRDARLKEAEDQFISLVSHQLRTPLTSIRLFSEMLTKGQVGKLSDKQGDYIDKIHISTIRMIRLVGDILNVSRIELNRLKIEPKPIDVNSLIESCIEEVKPLADEKDVALQYEPPNPELPKVNLDASLFGQIIHNLLTNAIRYTKSPGGHVKIAFGQDGQTYQLSVTDNGIGIPKKAQDHIFNRFYRAPNAISAVGDGTGLGLYLVKMILEQSGGSISFNTEENQGTTFYVKIPLMGMQPKQGEKGIKKN